MRVVTGCQPKIIIEQAETRIDGCLIGKCRQVIDVIKDEYAIESTVKRVSHMRSYSLIAFAQRTINTAIFRCRVGGLVTYQLV